MQKGGSLEPPDQLTYSVVLFQVQWEFDRGGHSISTSGHYLCTRGRSYKHTHRECTHVYNTLQRCALEY